MPDDLVTVEKYQFLPEAQAAQLHLEEEGIVSFLADAETVNMDWLLGNAIGYIKLQVPRDQAQAALTVLEHKRAQTYARQQSESADASGEACLACGRKLPTNQPTCAACGWTYTSEGEQSPPEVAFDE